MVQNFYQKLIGHIKRHPTGISLQQLQDLLGTEVPKRTLQRWLKELVDNNAINILGKGRATKYCFYRLPAEKAQRDEGNVKLSSKSNEIIKIIRQPIQKRIPVGYHRKFLDEYKPNITYYLSTPLRTKLKKLGASNYTQAPAGTYAKQIMERLLIDLSWNSSRLEGNTYSFLDTQNLIQFGETAAGKNALETQMILNHKCAIEFLVQNSDLINFNPYTILNLHALLSNNLLSNPNACGQLRKIPVAIGQTVFEPVYIPQLVDEIFHQILSIAQLIQDPFEQSFFTMVHLPYLQPFEDVNKRVSRLAANISFIKHNLCPLSFMDVPEQTYLDGIIGVYELNKIEVLRDVFVWGYERSCQRYLATRQSLGEPDIFRLKYRLQMAECINAIIKSSLPKKESVQFIKKWSLQHIHKPDCSQFNAVILQELQCLHEGNIARFRIPLDSFRAWSKTWN